MPSRKLATARTVGVYLVGGLGDIATTLLVGACAIRRGLASRTGLVTDLPPLDALGLIEPAALRFGGADIRPGTPLEAAGAVYRASRTFSRELLDGVRDDLAQLAPAFAHDPALQWSTACAPGDPPLAEIAARLRARLRAFAQAHDGLVVVNLASADAAPAPSACTTDLDALEAALAGNRKDLITPAMLAMHCALMEGHPYVNFTPNAGPELPSLRALAQARRVPHCGNDAKTGETLVKTALAPMFAWRNLRVLSWEGVNLLGNNDGRMLAEPQRRAAKLRNKRDVLEKLLGYPLHSDVAINYVPSLGDWKTAWDLIHFQGFLDVPMTMQFTWQGCDSVLAAPLVLDMVRLADLARRRGEAGAMRHLACFFKNPIDVDEAALHAQFALLLAYARDRAAPRAAGRRGIRRDPSPSAG
jgi:myo-inositol-1-phosphate synthase